MTTLDLRAVALAASRGQSRADIGRRMHKLRPKQSAKSYGEALSRWLGPEGDPGAHAAESMSSTVLEVLFEVLKVRCEHDCDV